MPRLLGAGDNKIHSRRCRFTTQSLNYVGDACVEFHYEAYGDTVNALAVYTQTGVRDWRAARVQLWSVRGNQGNIWIRQRIAFRSNNKTLRVCTVACTI